MARSAHIEYSAQHAGLLRAGAVAEAIGNLDAHVILGVLAVIGLPVTRAAAAIRGGYAAWAQARKQRRDDERLWAVALQDARVMADLSRAMSHAAARDIKQYY